MTKIIKLVKCGRRKGEKNKPFSKYTLCVVKKSSHKRNVIEKLGIYDKNHKLATLNVYRLIFWLSKEVGVTGPGLKFLTDIGIIVWLINKQKSNFNIIKKKKWY